MSYSSRFVSKCLRVTNTKRPIKHRCNKELPAKGNGLLCNKCLEDAKKGRIPILMCADVTKTFGIPWKNQVFVYIDLSNGSGKSKSPKEQLKDRLTRSMNGMSIDNLKKLGEKVGLNNLDKICKKSGDVTELRTQLTMGIVYHLLGRK